MPTGLVLTVEPNAANFVDNVIEQARRAKEAGVRQIWVPQQFDVDAIALAGLIGAAAPGLGVGTSVVPINPRHPLIVASLAQTAQAATHGNFSLGLGLGAHEPERKAFGDPFPNTLQRLREHLSVLRSIFDTGTVAFDGELLHANPEWPVAVAGGTPVPVYVAAMGPKALQVTGELADGTLPYLAGPRTLAEFIKPTIDKAAAEAGRPQPRIIAAVPVLVSDDVDAARTAAAERLTFYEAIPSYQKVIAREGIDETVELAAVGSPQKVVERLKSYLNAGADELILSPIPTENVDTEALWDVVRNIDET